MDLLAAGRVLARRWLLFALMLVLAAAGTVEVYWKVPPTYQVSATLLVLPPVHGDTYLVPPPPQAVPPAAIGGPSLPAPTPTPIRLQNPYLTVGSTELVLARTLTESLGSDGEHAKILAAGGSHGYSVATSLDQPIVTITVTDHDRARETRTLHALIDAANADIAARQQATGLPPENWAALTPVVVSDKPANTHQNLKVLGAIAALALVAAASVVLVADSMAASRRRRIAWQAAAGGGRAVAERAEDDQATSVR